MGAGGSVLAEEMDQIEQRMRQADVPVERYGHVLRRESTRIKSKLDVKQVLRGTGGEKAGEGGAEHVDDEHVERICEILFPAVAEGNDEDEDEHEDELFHGDAGAPQAEGTAYVPKPADTSGVVLPAHLEQLTELLAENAHEEWARQRISDGWTFGAKRDDELKHHPCLISYAALTETEREYDRITAMNTLKLLLSFGYVIDPPPAQQAKPGQQDKDQDQDQDQGNEPKPAQAQDQAREQAHEQAQ